VDLKDEPYMLPTPVQATYKAGDIVEFSVGIQAEHDGHYQFRICDKVLDGKTLKSHQEGEDCLNKHVLKRAPPSGTKGDSQPIDVEHPDRWYVGAHGKGSFAFSSLNPNTPVVGEDWDSDRDFPQMQKEIDESVGIASHGSTYKMKYVIPDDLSCEKCTLQWWWVSANKCAHDKDVGEYWSRNGMNPRGKTTPLCGPSSGIYAEEFWNCADITILPKATEKPKGGRRRKSGKGSGKGSSGKGGKGGGRRRRRRKSSSRRRRKD